MSLPAWSKALSQNVNMAKTHLALDITQLFCPAGVNQHKHIHETLFSFFFFFHSYFWFWLWAPNFPSLACWPAPCSFLPAALKAKFNSQCLDLCVFHWFYGLRSRGNLQFTLATWQVCCEVQHNIVSLFKIREIRNAKNLTYVDPEAFKNLPNLKYLWVLVITFFSPPNKCNGSIFFFFFYKILVGAPKMTKVGHLG